MKFLLNAWALTEQRSNLSMLGKDSPRAYDVALADGKWEVVES